jgi:hypothetical protein
MMRSLICKRCIRQSYVAAAPILSAKLPSFEYRGYATKPSRNPKFDLPNEYTEEVFNSLANNPAIMQALHDVIESLKSRGITLDKEPSVSEMWSIMKDKQIITALENCALLKYTG